MGGVIVELTVSRRKWELFGPYVFEMGLSPEASPETHTFFNSTCLSPCRLVSCQYIIDHNYSSCILLHL